jgi:hypothetical protein
MSLPDWILPYKEPRTEIKRIQNKYYKYEVCYQYDPKRKRTIKKTVKLLGKVTETEGFIPSEKNRLREEAKKLPTVDIKTFGVYALFENLLNEEIAVLRNMFGDKIAEQLSSIAMMRWAYQSPIKRIAHYHSHDFCSEYWSREHMLSDKEVAAVLKTVGETGN